MVEALGRARVMTEPCDDCGRPNHPIAWHVPDELWLAAVGRSSGFLCIPCFTDLAKSAGIEISWIGSRFDITDSETWVISNQMNLDAEVVTHG